MSNDPLSQNSSQLTRYANPYYGVGNTLMPQNIDGMLWWAQHLLFKNGFYRAALSRIVNYFITNYELECDDEKSKKQLQEALDTADWRGHVAQVGLDYLAYGNSIVTIAPGFDRFLACPKCNKVHAIEQIDFKFDKWKYHGECRNPKCKYKGVMQMTDRPSHDGKRVTVTHWSPREIVTIVEDTTGHTDYYWNIPPTYQQRLTGPLKQFYAKNTPEIVMQCVEHKKMMNFRAANFLHSKFPTPSTLRTDGRAVPMCMYMFDDFFQYQTLKRFNEVICFEDIAPFRVISASASGNNPMANPILNQNGAMWRHQAEELVKQHRKDPGSYHIAPFPIEYQQLGGQGKTLAPVELLDMTKANILGALNIPQELFNSTLSIQAVGPALRLFENSWSHMMHTYNIFLQKWVDVLCKTKGIKGAKIKLLSTTLSDDMERKGVLSQLVSANAIARSEMLRMYNLDYDDQLRKKMQEDLSQQRISEEEQKKQQLAQQNDANIFNLQQQAQGQQGGQPGAQPSEAGLTDADFQASGNPNDVLAQAQSIAQRLMPLDGAARRKELQRIKGVNQTLWAQVKVQLEEQSSSARSQGLQQAKQQQ